MKLMTLAMLYRDLRMTLEATAARDIEFQERAQKIAHGVKQRFSGKTLEELRRVGCIHKWQGDNHPFYDADITDLDSNRQSKKLALRLVRQGKWLDMAKKPGVKGYLQHRGRGHGVVFLPWIQDDAVKKLSPKDLSMLVHELVHFFDYQRHGPEKVKAIHRNRVEKDIKLGSQDYYEDPLEFNAYYQQGATKIRDAMGGKSLGAFPEFHVKATRPGKFFSAKFIKQLGQEYRRKLDQRLYQLWAGLKKRGRA
jgi:hypothetical protein